MGSPPPNKARQVLKKGEVRPFVLAGLDPPRRVAELALPSSETGTKKRAGGAKAAPTATRATRTKAAPAAKKAAAKKAAAKKAGAVGQEGDQEGDGTGDEGRHDEGDQGEEGTGEEGGEGEGPMTTGALR